jgi:hypothetical protein
MTAEPIRIETTFEVVSIRCSRSPEWRAAVYTSIRVLVLQVDWREKAGSIKLSGRVGSAEFEVAVLAQTKRFAGPKAL